MSGTLHLQIVSPERLLVDEQVSEVQIPALDGFLGVLPGHAALLSELKPGGVLSYTVAGKTTALAVYGGFVEVLPESVKVLSDGAEFAHEINIAEAQKRFNAAMKAVEDTHGEAADPAVALAEMMRAQAQVEAAQRKQ
jgi:F-type H+-transporting ATPase subunit epsilon